MTDDKFKPTRVGYTFGGWYKDAACTDGQSVGNSIAIGEGGQRIYAKWIANQYTITFDSKGGTPVGSITQDYNTEVTAPANPTRTGYTFQGWDIAVPAKMPARNMTFNALWKVNQHEVTYKYNDNTTADKVENLNYGEPVVEPAAPEWEGHVFCGWKYEPGGEVSFPFAMPDANVTLKAVWKESQTAPNPPDIDIDTVEPTSITLKGTKNGEEYILVPKGTAPTDEDWKNAKKLGDGVTQIVFGGLVPNTEYDVYARKFETEGTDSTLGKAPSPASQPTSATTPKQNQAAPAAPTVRPAGSTSMVVDPTQDGVEYAIVPKRQEQLLSDAVWKSPSKAGGTVVFGGLEPETEYVAYVRMKETDRQNPSEPSQRSDSAKTLKLPEITAPTVMEGLVYAGEGHELLNAGSTEQGTMLYRLGDGEWSEDVPAGLDAGAYDVWYMVRGDTGNGYGDTEPVELAAAIAKAPSTVTAPTGKALTYNGTAQTLADAGSAEGGELLYAVATENVAPEESAYAAELPAATDVGSYFVWYMVKGDANHEDIAPDKVESSIAEVDKAELEEAIGEAGAFYEGIKDDHPDMAKALKDAIDDAKGIADNKNVTAEQVAGALAALQEARAKAGADVVTYFCLSGSVASWTKGSPDPLTFTFKRTVEDEKTFESFKGAKVDGADVPESAYTAAEGSLVLSLMAAYLETLSPGDHELAVAFEDGEATATFTVKAAETNDAEKAAKADGAAAKGGSASGSSKAASAKTGDSVPVALMAICVALAAAALIVAVLAIRKRRAGK